MRQNRIDASQLELTEKVVSIKRVTKVVKGGRNFRFTALVVVGDGKGHVGAGLGKATEIPEAIRKGKEDAMKKLITVSLDENESVTHDLIGKFGSASVLLKKTKEQNSKNKIPNTNKGITLIALVITIIVMLILVGVSVTVALKGDLFGAAQKAARNTAEARNQELSLASGKVTIGGKTYNSIEEYVVKPVNPLFESDAPINGIVPFS